MTSVRECLFCKIIHILYQQYDVNKSKQVLGVITFFVCHPVTIVSNCFMCSKYFRADSCVQIVIES
jgi:hypothetical protein